MSKRPNEIRPPSEPRLRLITEHLPLAEHIARRFSGRGEVRRQFRDTGWSTRVPRASKDLKQTLGKASGALAHDLGRAPTPSELAAHLGMDVEDVREGLLAAEAYRALNRHSRPRPRTVTAPQFRRARTAEVPRRPG